MRKVCPAGHFSTDEDYCSDCGKPMRAGAAATAAPPTDQLRQLPAAPAGTTDPAQGASVCPDCGTRRAPASRYCEVCRYDFAAGQSFTGLSSVAPPPARVSAAPTGSPGTVTPAAVAGHATTTLAETVGPGVGRCGAGSERLLLSVGVDESLNTEPDPATPCPVGSPGRVYHLDLPENTLGRQYEGHGIHPEIVVNDPGISRRHLKFVRTADGAYDVLELGSANGTKLNAISLQTGVAVRIQPGDQLTLGMWTRIHVQARQAG